MIKGDGKKAVVLLIILSMLLTILPHFNSSIKGSEYYKSIIPVSSSVTESEIVEMIKKVNTTDIKKYLEDFVEFGPKWTGTKACDEAAEYIYNNFKLMGLDVAYQNWSFPLRKGRNVVATQQGIDCTSDAVFIICAHYDTVKDSPGANDDGSGIAAMLTIANITSRYSFNHTLRFLAVSGHECGPAYTYGSTYYAKKAYARNENIIAVLNLDMIGNTTEDNKIQIHKQERTEWISQLTLDVLEKYNEYIDVVVEPITGILGADQKSFLDYGYDAVFFHQPHSWDPIFQNHKPGDNISAINFDFLVNVTKLILVVVSELADKPIDLQVRIIEPCEGYLYLSNYFKFELPCLNFYGKKDRGMTVVLGGFTAKFNISTKEDIDVVYCIIDDKTYFDLIIEKLPYEITVNKSFLICHSILTGFHTFRFLVTTNSGKTAYDEMDIFLLP